MYNNNNQRGFAPQGQSFQQQGNTNYQPGRMVTQNSGPTQGQVKYYLDLCNQKAVQPDPAYMSYTRQQMSQEIDRLMSMASPGFSNQQQSTQDFQGFEQVSQPVQQQTYQAGPENTPATEKQIQAMISIGNELGLRADEAVLRQMNMAQASQQLDRMIQMRKTKVDAGPSVKQLQLLEDMSYCPDIDVEAFYRLFPIKQETLIEKSKLENQMRFILKQPNNDEERKVVGDKIVEINNLIEQIIKTSDWNKLNRRDVSNFIQDNQQVFYAWKDNQATPAQVNLILQLQEQLHTFTNNWRLNLDGLASDMTGAQIDNRDELLSDFNEAIDFNLKEEDFRFVTKAFATEYISQLQKELTRLSNPSTTNTEREYEAEQNALTEQEANEMYEQRVVDMIFGLYAMLGQSAEDSTINASNVNEELKELIEMNILYSGQEDQEKAFNSIKQYVDNFVDADQLFATLEIA